MERLESLVMGTEDLFKRLGQILQQMKAGGDLHRIRLPLPYTSGIVLAAFHQQIRTDIGSINPEINIALMA
jgi:hypothetical protein